MRVKAARALNVLLLVGIIGLLIPVMGTVRDARAAALPRHALRGQTPSVVVDGSATPHGQQDPATSLTLNIGLATHDSAALDALIAAASDPASPSYGHYLTPPQYMARFAPTDAEVAAVRAWAATAGLQVSAVSPDHLLMTVRATTGAVEQALGVRVNTYSLHGRVFRANDRDPTVPANLDIRAVSGLSTLVRFHAMQRRTPIARALTRTGTRTGDVRLNGFYPDDFRAAYNAGPVGDGSGQTIGLTLWGAPLPQSDLDSFAVNTGTPRLVGGQSGNDGVDWISVDGAPSTDTSVLDEVALDVEYTHGVAPHSHLKYWLAPCGYDPSLGYCNPSDTGLEDAVNAAAHAHDTDPSLHAVSNSWGGNEPATADDMAFVSNIDASLQYAASQGVTFYFSSGDFGYASGANCDPSKTMCTQALPSYPADSPYAVAVGGTALNTGSGYSYGSETAWNSSGGGCSTVEPRPVWQTGVAAATCAGRAEPDVSAAADPNAGAYVFFNGAPAEIGGTSLAAPLWVGMMTDVNRSLTTAGRPATGFAAPRLYALATDTATYSRDFHDITIGNNDPTGAGGAYAQSAGAGWDEVTGWGSPNLANLADDWTGAGSGPVATATSPSNTTPGASATPSPSSTSGADAVPTSTSTATPAPTDTATPSPVPTSTNTSTATPSPTDTSTSTATPSPTNTSTATPTNSATPTATVTARPIATATTAPEVFTSTSVRVAATPTARAAYPVRRLGAVKATATPIVAVNVRPPNGGVTLHSVVTVDGRTRPGVTVAISASLTTTSTIARRTVIYAPTTASAPRLSNKSRKSSKKGVKPAARTCRKGASGCVAHVVTRRVVRTTLLYRTRTATRARADRGGRFSARVRLDYRPRATARVTLTVTLTTVAPHGQFVRAMLVKIMPPPQRTSGNRKK